MPISDNFIRQRVEVRRLLILAFGLILSSLHAFPTEKIAGISRAQADSLGRETVIYEGIPVTFNTLARDLLKQLYGHTSYRGLTAEQTIASIRLYPLEWKDEPLIRIKDKWVAGRLGAKNEYVPLSFLFDAAGSYRVTPLYAVDSSKKVQKAITEIDSQAGIMLGIISGEMIIKDEEIRLPEWRVKLELLYNRIPLRLILFILLFCGAALSISRELYERISGKRLPPFLRLASTVFLPLAFVVSVINFTLEWILAGRIPLCNTGETLGFTVLVALGVMLLMKNKGEMLCGCLMLFWGCVALVCYLMGGNPVVTPLMPALQSPWLSIHVTLVMAAYSLFGLTFVISLIGICNHRGGKNLGKETFSLLIPGVLLLAAGIVTGSIWAKDAWGAYWSWDPKETWALVTQIIYILPLVLRLRGKNLYICLIIAFCSVVMTYFGVNYFLGGRHSYV